MKRGAEKDLLGAAADEEDPSSRYEGPSSQGFVYRQGQGLILPDRFSAGPASGPMSGPVSGPASGKEIRRMEAADTAINIVGEAINFLHAGFATIALPHSRPADEYGDWRRSVGRFHLIVESGKIFDPALGDWKKVGLPFGVYARLINIYLQTYAIRNRTRTVNLGRSMTSWMSALGMTPRGGPRGNIAPFKDQVLRLARSKLSMWIEHDDGRFALEDQHMVDGLDGWVVSDSPWVDNVELTQRFYDHLREHAIPLCENAIGHLQNSSIGLDLYVFLVYRLPKLSRPLRLSWGDLGMHIGSQFTRDRALGDKIRQMLPDVLSVYPGARVEEVKGGLVLHPSPPAIPSNKVQAILPKGRKPSTREGEADDDLRHDGPAIPVRLTSRQGANTRPGGRRRQGAAGAGVHAAEKSPQLSLMGPLEGENVGQPVNDGHVPSSGHADPVAELARHLENLSYMDRFSHVSRVNAHRQASGKKPLEKGALAGNARQLAALLVEYGLESQPRPR